MTDLDETQAEDAPNDEMWRGMLDGSDASLRQVRSFWRRVPSAPRCKVCAAPFHGFGGLLSRVIKHTEVMPGNPLMCNACFGSLVKHPGGAEVDISVLFADIRGSKPGASRHWPLMAAA